MDMVDFSKEKNSYIGLILDEVHNLIYDKNEGTVIGFSN